MNEKQINKFQVAHLANEFALNGKIDFNNAREWLIFLYLVAQLDPINQDEIPPAAIIPVADLKKVLQDDNKRWGGLYDEIRGATKRMAKVVCAFDSEVYINGKPLPVYIPIFAEIGAKKTKDGGVYVSFEFNRKMKPLLLGFRRNFLGIKLPRSIASGHAIRFLIYAKAERDRRRKKDGEETIITFEIEDLKKLLNIQGKYKQIKDFKKYVIQPIEEGINKSGILEITKIEYTKTGRSITGIIFSIHDFEDATPLLNTGATKANTLPTEEELQQLTFAKEKAYFFLVEKGIYEGIAFRKIIPNMPSSICEGYEDYFCEEVYKIIIEKSKAKDDQGRAAVLVDWFKKDIFKTDYFSHIIENVHQRKRNLGEDARANREIAKTMTVGQFKNYYKKINQQTKVDFVQKMEQVKLPKVEEPAVEPLFDFHEWKVNYPDVYAQIETEQLAKFKILVEGMDLDEAQQKQLLARMIENAVKKYVKQV